MGLKIIQCGRPTVRVIQPDGQIRQFLLPIKVSDLLSLHPHHYVSQAKATINNSKPKGPILSLDTHLESGGIYILLPLPRLFPCSSSSSSASSSVYSCSCFLHMQDIAFVQWSSVQGPSVKISTSEAVVAVKPRRLWEPALEVISEDRLLLQTKDEEKSAGKNKKKKMKNGAAANGGLKPRFGVRSWRKKQ